MVNAMQNSELNLTVTSQLWSRCKGYQILLAPVTLFKDCKCAMSNICNIDSTFSLISNFSKYLLPSNTLLTPIKFARYIYYETHRQWKTPADSKTARDATPRPGPVL